MEQGRKYTLTMYTACINNGVCIAINITQCILFINCTDVLLHITYLQRNKILQIITIKHTHTTGIYIYIYNRRKNLSVDQEYIFTTLRRDSSATS